MHLYILFQVLNLSAHFLVKHRNITITYQSPISLYIIYIIFVVFKDNDPIGNKPMGFMGYL